MPNHKRTVQKSIENVINFLRLRTFTSTFDWLETFVNWFLFRRDSEISRDQNQELNLKSMHVKSLRVKSVRIKSK